jgi:hypothetical protein
MEKRSKCIRSIDTKVLSGRVVVFKLARSFGLVHFTFCACGF